MMLKKTKIAILIVVAAALAAFVFRSDIMLLYSQFTRNLPQIEKEISNVLQKAGKQIINPPPLVGGGESKNSLLTKEGVIVWTNKQRQAAGLPNLKENTKLDASAQAKVLDMFLNQYFEHESPSGKGVGDLAEAQGYDFLVIGENLALGNFENDQVLVQAWMDSPGHRANILNVNYQEIGVWVQKGTYQGKTTWIAVQHFGKPLSACPQPPAWLKSQIDADKITLENMEIQIKNLQAEIEQIGRRDRNLYNQKAKGYNDLVLVYNALLAQDKDLISQYNEKIEIFNACAAAP
jgi:uncharacterized protein YkwD